MRGNSKLSRDVIIKVVADAVGPEHPVNLKNYDHMILVDVAQVSFVYYGNAGSLADLSQNVIGMSVVGGDYDKLKRFNLAEIYDPSPKGGPETPSTKHTEPKS